LYGTFRQAGPGQGAHVSEMELPPQIAPQGSWRDLMSLQGIGIAPAGTHSLQIGRHGLPKSGQGKMTGPTLPSGTARRAGVGTGIGCGPALGRPTPRGALIKQGNASGPACGEIGQRQGLQKTAA
jgi:hypothetical protein